MDAVATISTPSVSDGPTIRWQRSISTPSVSDGPIWRYEGV